MKKTRFFLLLTVMLFAMNRASAYDFEVDGIYYNVVSLSELTCEVVRGNSRYSGDVVIPAHVNYANKTLTVVKIEDYLFYCNSYEESELTGITIPNTVTSISDKMFQGCRNLKRVKIEDGETVLKLGVQEGGFFSKGEGLFYGCPITSLYVGRNLSYNGGENWGYSPFYENGTLKEVTIGNSVTEIASHAFSRCTGLTSVTIPNSVTEIGEYAFSNCTGLTSVTIGNSVTKIGYSAFDGCTGLTSVTIGNSVTEIGDYAFSRCTGLTSVTIGNSVTEIGDYAFSNCTGLTSITIPNSVTEIASHAFSRCTGLTGITIPNSVTKIGDYVFYGCTGLTSVAIPNSVTRIGECAFDGCTGLTSITIPNSVTKIGYSAFDGCTGLTSITIGNSVTEIASYAFYGCAALTALYILATTPPTMGYNFLTKQYMTLNVFVPQEALSAYQSTSGWKNFWNLQGFDPTGIESVKSITPNTKNCYYDLRGNRLTAPKRGLNIINGKKVIVK